METSRGIIGEARVTASHAGFPIPSCIKPPIPAILKLRAWLSPRYSCTSGAPRSTKLRAPCCCDRRVAHIDSMIVAVDGAYPGNGANPTESSCGVYVGPDNRHNISILMPDY